MFFRGLYISAKQKHGHSPYKVPFLFYETGALGGANNDFKANNYCFLRNKVGCDGANSPVYEL
jgi:hypothetical protein